MWRVRGDAPQTRHLTLARPRAGRTATCELDCAGSRWVKKRVCRSHANFHVDRGDTSVLRKAMCVLLVTQKSVVFHATGHGLLGEPC